MNSSRIRFDALKPCELTYRTNGTSKEDEEEKDDDEHQHRSEKRNALEHLDRNTSSENDYLNLHIKPMETSSTNLVRRKRFFVQVKLLLIVLVIITDKSIFTNTCDDPKNSSRPSSNLCLTNFVTFTSAATSWFNNWIISIEQKEEEKEWRCFHFVLFEEEEKEKKRRSQSVRQQAKNSFSSFVHREIIFTLIRFLTGEKSGEQQEKKEEKKE